jgi:large subunit ribosomal protein L15
MKLHDLRPPAGSHTARTRVGRGIAAGKGKTAGRGTKGQKARAGGGIPPWFEGGQTPLHMRIPKLRGFKNPFKTDYEVVNVGAIGVLAERGAFEGAEPEGLKPKSGKSAPPTINQDILRAVGLVRTLKKPLKILGAGDLSSPLFVVADAFTKSAVAKIEAAGGTVSVLEVPAETKAAIGLGEDGARAPREARTAAGRAAADRKVDDRAARDTFKAEVAAEEAAAVAAKAAKPAKAAKAKAAANDADTADAEAASDTDGAVDADAVVADVAPDARSSASPIETADATEDTDAPAGDSATETGAADDDENA